MKSWCELVQVHPAAELFPMMSSEELDALARDIDEHGLQHPVILWTPQRRTELSTRRGSKNRYPKTIFLLDGRNRLEAIQRSKEDWSNTDDPIEDALHFTLDNSGEWATWATLLYGNTDPYAYVISTNMHRRHLSQVQKRDVVEKLLKATPERSDRATAKLATVSDKTVASVRKELEETAEIPQLDATVGADGKSRPRSSHAVERDEKRIGQNATKRKIHGKVQLREITIPYSAAQAARMLIERWSPELCYKLIAELERRLAPHTDPVSGGNSGGNLG